MIGRGALGSAQAAWLPVESTAWCLHGVLAALRSPQRSEQQLSMPRNVLGLSSVVNRAGGDKRLAVDQQ
jgi:hypothetical protein